jgi:hypothetical protein
MLDLRRRQFMTLLSGAVAAWPLAARAQQLSVQTIGYLSPRSSDVETEFLTALRQGLRETGYVEGRNLVASIAGRRGATIGSLPLRPNSRAAR